MAISAKMGKDRSHVFCLHVVRSSAKDSGQECKEKSGTTGSGRIPRCPGRRCEDFQEEEPFSFLQDIVRWKTNKKMKIQGIVSAAILAIFWALLISDGEALGGREKAKTKKTSRKAEGARARKAHFRNIGKLVPYAKNVEVVLTVDFDAALSDARKVATELASHVDTLKDKAGVDSAYVRSLNLTVQSGLARFRQHEEDLAAITDGGIKRAFMEGIGTLVSLFQTWVNRGSITDLQHNEDVLHREIGTNRNLMGKAVKTMGKLRQGGVDDLHFQEISTEVQLGFEHLNNGLKEMVDAAFQAAQGEVHRLLAPATILTEIKSHVFSVARKKDLDSVYTHAAEFIGAPKSVMLGTKGLAVVLHIPMVDQTTGIMTLYHLEAVEVIREHSVEKVQVDKPFLGKDGKGWRVTLGSDEIALCNQVGDLRLCYHNRQLKRGIFDCTTSLFDASQQGEWCASTLWKGKEESITYMGSNYFYGRAGKVTVSCGNVTKDQDWGLISYRPVAPVCTAQGSSFIILGGHSQSLKKSLTKAFAAPREAGNFNGLPIEEGAAGSSLRSVDTAEEIPVMEKLRKTDWTVQILIYVGIGMVVLVVLLAGGLLLMWRYNLATRARFVAGLAGFGSQWRSLAGLGTVEGNPDASADSVPSATGKSDSGLGSSLTESIGIKEVEKVKKFAAAVSEAAAAAAALKAARSNVEGEGESADQEGKKKAPKALEDVEAVAAARAATAPQPGELFDPAAESSPKKMQGVERSATLVRPPSTFLLSK